MRSDEESDFVDFMTSTTARFFRFAYLLTGDPHEAEELLQDAYVAVYGKWPHVQKEYEPSSYMYTTLRRKFINGRTVGFRRFEKITDRLPEVADEDHDISRLLDHDEVMNLLGALSEKQRYVVVARYFAGLKVREVAIAMSTSEGNVVQLTARAYRLMRAVAEREGGHDE
ncbi:RNA polymerase sigma factor [Nocardioides sp.]|uniref:RNA polymerase sigma factor n=1 Tax=Nocardioides sp. TaxID=35761 RepID=UPI00271CE952|nr:sigma-70 family RNA polymerase sigma factor [Nocardioides sp.]MDO9455978.1 sigma-70 family RNA polymerase sigma factor [Nocardioides sp.]